MVTTFPSVTRALRFVLGTDTKGPVSKFRGGFLYLVIIIKISDLYTKLLRTVSAAEYGTSLALARE